ncbi:MULTISPECIES: cytochrome P450 [unclassified Streptomyces]|uniref:cytochrome P450 n=1 Tax=unclassified Streptomyces TaxID=2593676 RepID=UPI0022B62367|nr:MULTISPECIES: cytochrome P450 [unclassified Streptomyces]MCZ7417351.1 cytochrome P450 [Streptomyces sp. WMMC897]MCZ7432822.1 cytochrome P450 [Streptomyces sp. WMMC1477]
MTEQAELPTVLGGFDLTDQAEFAKGFPHEVFARLRAEAPVLWHPPGQTADGEGFWVLSGYADLKEAAEDPVFSSQGGGGREGGGTHIDDLKAGVHAGVLINMIDDPRHELIKTLVGPPVARRAVEARLPELRAVAERYVEQAVRKGTADFQPDVSAPYAIECIARVLGVPEADLPQLIEWGQAVSGFDDRASGKVNENSAKVQYAIYEYGQSLIARKRAEPHTTDDLMSVMAREDIPGDTPLSEYEREAFFNLLLLAGSEPARNTMAAGVLALAEHPEQWEALRADRSLLPGAIEEMLRWSSPTPYNRRTATRDTVFRDAEIKAGEKVTFWWASANRDASVFAEPTTFDIRRSPNPHLAFGHGTHSCLGEQLARTEIRLLLEALLERVREIRISGPVEWAPSNKHTVTLRMPVELA